MDCVIWVILQNSGTSFRTVGCEKKPVSVVHYIGFKGGPGKWSCGVADVISHGIIVYLPIHVNVCGCCGEFKVNMGFEEPWIDVPYHQGCRTRIYL